MSAPTPIRALVHSRTLVTAGLLIILKLNGSISREIVLFLGTITIVVAGTVRVIEIDLKKVVALSTLRQLGLIMTILGTGIRAVAFLHILTHAFVKRALFIVVGVVLHNSLRNQDGRLIIERGPQEKYCFTRIAICGIALCGLGLASRGVSKEIFLLRIGEITRSPFVIVFFL
jgi:NADH-ubiquinone oxidoreductase chain 5